MAPKSFTVSRLARLAGVSVRTLRVREGLAAFQRAAILANADSRL